MNSIEEKKLPIHPEPNKRYRYCCRKCKHAEKGKKTCVCVVPKSKRRLAVHQNGCQTCGCMGCSIEDFLDRGEDPEYHPNQTRKQQSFDGRNGCCRRCMKAFSHSGRSCVCQVPREQRQSALQEGGCKICGCAGCHPRDLSNERDGSSWSSMQSLSSVQFVDGEEYNLDNVDRSMLGRVVRMEYGMTPGMLGLGIPQRTYSYIMGKPQNQ